MRRKARLTSASVPDHTGRPKASASGLFNCRSLRRNLQPEMSEHIHNAGGCSTQSSQIVLGAIQLHWGTNLSACTDYCDALQILSEPCCNTAENGEFC